MATSMNSATVMAKAKEILWGELPAELMDASIGQSGPDAFDFLMEVPVPGADPHEVFVTLKLTAHKFYDTDKTSAYDGFQAVQDFKAMQECKAKEKAAKAAEKAAKAKAKEDKAKAAPSES